MVMSAWYGEPKLKAAAMERLREDRSLDRLTQGVYWDSYRGCHLGCLTRCSNNSQEATERMFAIPTRIAYLMEAIFEGLPKDQCGQWVIDGTDAIPVGADLSRTHHHLVYWLLGPESPSAEGNANESVAGFVAQCRELHRLAAAGVDVNVTTNQWSAAWSAAWPAWSAWSAAESAESARSAAEFARSAAEYAESATWSAAWSAIAAKTIEIFRSSPVVACDSCDEAVASSMLVLCSPVGVGA